MRVNDGSVRLFRSSLFRRLLCSCAVADEGDLVAPDQQLHKARV
jgi:hypothetical protein